MVMDSPKAFSMFPNGSGDFISAINDKKLMSICQEQNIKYLCVCPSNNILDPMVDCVSLGYLVRHKLDIVGKCVTDADNSASLSRVLDINERMYVGCWVRRL